MKINQLLVIIMVVGILAFGNSSYSFTAVKPVLTVTFIDVGQGDSILIQDDQGFDILIDGGLPAAGQTVVDFLREKGIDDIDVMVATHPHNDHFGGLTAVLRLDDIPVRAVYHNGYASTTNTWRDFESAVAQEGLSLEKLQYPSELSWGTVKVYVLNPEKDLADPEHNDVSIVLLLEYADVHFLFTADIDQSVEAKVINRGIPITADILKVGHHGDVTSTGNDLLEAVRPKDAVIQVGMNRSGQPSNIVLNRLQTTGSWIWRNDLNGNIVVTTDGYEYTVQTERPRYIYLPILVLPPD